MVVGEFTASNINMEEDAREAEEKQRKSTLDLGKFRADVAAAAALAAKGPQLQAGLDALLALEKTARLAEDITACKLACGAVLERCHAAGEWRLLEENATLLAKRRGQLKQATQHVVRVAMALLDSAPDKATQVSLIKALQAVTEGKIFVEIERARLTRRLARIKEADGDVAGAADELQEVAVVRCLFVYCFFGGGGPVVFGRAAGFFFPFLFPPSRAPHSPSPHPTPFNTPPPSHINPTGDVRRHGQDREDRLHPRPGPPLPGKGRPRARADPRAQGVAARVRGEEGGGEGRRDRHRGHGHRGGGGREFRRGPRSSLLS
jgi:hypothetical protein